MSESATDAAVARPSRGRGVAAVIVFVIAALLFPVGVLAFWGQRTVINTEQYIATVEPLSSDPTVKDTVASLVSDQVVQAVDVGAALESYLPAQGKVLVGPLTAALDSLLDKAVRAVMDTPQFQKLWVAINTAAQKSLVALLEGKEDGPIQTTSNGEIVLDTTSVYQGVRQRMIDSNVPFATSLPETPKKTKQIVLYQSDQLERIQFIYSFTKPIATWLVVLAIALFVIALVLSRRRPRMLLAIGAAVIVGALVLKVALNIGTDQINLALQNTPLAVAEGVFFSTLTRFLANGTDWILGIGIALAALGWLFGSSAPATEIRRRTGADIEGEPGFAGWLRRYGRLLAVALAVVAVIVLLALSVTVGQLLLIAVVVAVGAALLWFSAARKNPAAPTAEA